MRGVDSGDWITLAAVVVAGIATVPAYLSLRFARAAADSAVAQTELQRQIAHEARLPMLWADVRPHPEARSVICLFIGNAGPTTAHDVRAVIEPRILPGQMKFACETGQDTAAAGIAAIPHGRTLEWSLGLGGDLLAVPGQPEQFTITITGKSGDGTAISDQFVTRFDDIRYQRASEGSVETIAQQLKHMLNEARQLNRTVERLVPHEDEAPPAM